MFIRKKLFLFPLLFFFSSGQTVRIMVKKQAPPPIKIGDGFRQKDAVYAQTSHMGKKKGQGDHNDDFPKQGEKDGAFGAP